MAFGFGVLRLETTAFWRMTPVELAAAARAIYGTQAGPPDAAALHALMDAFPD